MFTLNEITTLFVRVASLTAWWAGFLLQFVALVVLIPALYVGVDFHTGAIYSPEGVGFGALPVPPWCFVPFLLYGRCLQLGSAMKHSDWFLIFLLIVSALLLVLVVCLLFFFGDRALLAAFILFPAFTLLLGIGVGYCISGRAMDSVAGKLPKDEQ